MVAPSFVINKKILFSYIFLYLFIHQNYFLCQYYLFFKTFFEVSKTNIAHLTASSSSQYSYNQQNDVKCLSAAFSQV